MKSIFMIDLYADKLWKHRPGCFFQQLKSLLIMDSSKSHLVDVPDHFKGYNTEVKMINAGMTPLLQFIDTHINKSFKNKLREKWEDWMAHGIEEFTKSGNRRRAAYDLIATWIFDAWKQVAQPAFIIDGFRECGYIEWDGDHNKLHSRLRDTVLNREVPIEPILEVNDLLLELEQANDDIVAEDDEIVSADSDNDDDDDHQTSASDASDDEDIVIE